MGLGKTLKSLFSGGNTRDDVGYWIYVRCKRCGEAIKTRVDLGNDLSLLDEGGYTVHKTLVGRKLCFERIDVRLNFDADRHLVGQEISGGEFITAEEYQAAENATAE